ncbi:MAG: hypothetical protein ACRCVK_11370 [Aeromonas veronii]
MNPALTTLLLLRSISVLAGLQGKSALAQSLDLIADAAVAGVNVDAHMQQVADDLKAGKEPDLEDLRARIEAESARLQAP